MQTADDCNPVMTTDCLKTPSCSFLGANAQNLPVVQTPFTLPEHISMVSPLSLCCNHGVLSLLSAFGRIVCVVLTLPGEKRRPNYNFLC